MNIQNYISVFSDVEAYNASTLNCYAFRHGYDARQWLWLVREQGKMGPGEWASVWKTYY